MNDIFRRKRLTVSVTTPLQGAPSYRLEEEDRCAVAQSLGKRVEAVS
jgi:hypothetical protein